MVRYVTSGELTIDYVVPESGHVIAGSSGGGSLYSAIGARQWGVDVGIHSSVGRDYPDHFVTSLQAAGLHMDGVTQGSDCNSLSLWMLFEEENRKQQLPRLRSGTLDQLGRIRRPLPDAYLGARGFHLAPTLPGTHLQVKETVRRQAPNAIITMDLWVEPFFDAEPYRRPDLVRGLTALLPSRKEVEQLWGEPPDVVMRRLCGEGLACMAVKMDDEGSLVYDPRTQGLFHVPIITTAVADTTGAGDAYCGGFLVGLGETGDPVEAALRGTVSASFAVEDYGALSSLKGVQGEAQRRLERLRPSVRRLR